MYVLYLYIFTLKIKKYDSTVLSFSKQNVQTPSISSVYVKNYHVSAKKSKTGEKGKK